MYPDHADKNQFWKLLYACTHPVRENSNFGPVLKSGCPNLDERVANKISLLQDHKARGIWLMDASIVGVEQLPKKYKKKAINLTWAHYLREALEEINPAYIIVIGKGVYDILHPELRKTFPGRHDFIMQPQARISHDEHFRQFSRLYDLCQAHARGP
jgi:hypothetical protein